MFLTVVIISIPTIYLTNKIIKYLLPTNNNNKKNNILIKLGWKTLNLLSWFEIHINNIYNKIKNYLPILNKQINNPRIKFIFEGNEINNYEINNSVYTNTFPDKYDFVLYELPLSDKELKYDKHIIRYSVHSDIMEIEYNAQNDFNLLSIQIDIKNNKNKSVTYEINFGRTNYYIDGNILFDYKFLQWYLNTFNKVKLAKDDKYTVTFIDNNMNYITLHENEFILINKKNYDIIKTDTTTDKNNVLDGDVCESDASTTL